MSIVHFEADKHNFGQRVERIQRASDTWLYRKPRSVLWEQLFFGTDSPLRALFDEAGENGSVSLAELLFNLRVEVAGDWLGFSEEVTGSTKPITEAHFYSFGALMGYCFLFGVRDLHRENVVVTDSHLQVVDAEVVLVDLLLPHETAMLPFKDVPFEFSAGSLLAPSLDAITEAQAERLIAGYVDLFGRATQRRLEITRALEGIADTTAPVRVILRNTGAYRQILNGTIAPADLLPEERAQLERGDVPYFFKRIGGADLLWVSGLEAEIASVRAVGHFQPDVNRHAVPPLSLLASPELIEAKMVRGAFLLQKLLQAHQPMEFRWNGGALRMDADSLVNTVTGRTFRRAGGRKESI